MERQNCSFNFYGETPEGSGACSGFKTTWAVGQEPRLAGVLRSGPAQMNTGDSVAQKRLGLAGRTGLPDRRIKRKLDSYQARFFGTHKRVSVLTNGEATGAPDKNSINLKRMVT